MTSCSHFYILFNYCMVHLNFEINVIIEEFPSTGLNEEINNLLLTCYFVN